jgi:predicted dehydrogenase
MGNERARCCRRLGAHIVAVYDPVVERASALAVQHAKAVTCRTPEEVLSQKVDALFICTPPDKRDSMYHAVNVGVPFFVEKPLAISASEAAGMLASLRAKPVLHGVGYMSRWRAGVVHAKRTLSGKRFLGIVGYWAGPKYKVPWWLDPRSSGGPVNDQAIHLFDLCRFFGGEVISVQSAVDGHQIPLTLACSFRFASSALGALFYSCEAQDKQIGIRIVTAEGSLQLLGPELRLTENTIDGTFPENQDEDIFELETKQFLNAVLRNDPSLVASDFEDAYRTQRLVDAALSRATGV